MSAIAEREIPKTQKPKAVWDGILYEFQVFYLRPEGVPLQSMLVRAKTASQAAWHLENSGYQVTTVGTGRPVVDWNKPYFTRDEVQAMTGLGETAMSDAITEGHLRESSVRGVFAAKAVHEWLDSKL